MNTLLTRNTQDFKNIEDLNMENPWLWQQRKLLTTKHFTDHLLPVSKYFINLFGNDKTVRHFADEAIRDGII